MARILRWSLTLAVVLWAVTASVASVSAGGNLPPVLAAAETPNESPGSSLNMIGVFILMGQFLQTASGVAISAFERYRKADESSAVGQLRRAEKEISETRGLHLKEIGDIREYHAREVSRISEEHHEEQARWEELKKQLEADYQHRLNNKTQEITFLRNEVEEYRKSEKEQREQATAYHAQQVILMQQLGGSLDRSLANTSMLASAAVEKKTKTPDPDAEPDPETPPVR